MKGFINEYRIDVPPCGTCKHKNKMVDEAPCDMCHPSKNRHKKAPKNEMNRSISLIYANRPHLFHGLLDNEPLPV